MLVAVCSEEDARFVRQDSMLQVRSVARSGRSFGLCQVKRSARDRFSLSGGLVVGLVVGLAWSGVVWCGVVWSGVEWSGVEWCGVVWCGVVWCGVVWSGVVLSGVVWSGVV